MRARPVQLHRPKITFQEMLSGVSDKMFKRLYRMSYSVPVPSHAGLRTVEEVGHVRSSAGVLGIHCRSGVDGGDGRTAPSVQPAPSLRCACCVV